MSLRNLMPAKARAAYYVLPTPERTAAKKQGVAAKVAATIGATDE